MIGWLALAFVAGLLVGALTATAAWALMLLASQSDERAGEILQ